MCLFIDLIWLILCWYIVVMAFRQEILHLVDWATLNWCLLSYGICHAWQQVECKNHKNPIYMKFPPVEWNIHMNVLCISMCMLENCFLKIVWRAFVIALFEFTHLDLKLKQEVAFFCKLYILNFNFQILWNIFVA